MDKVDRALFHYHSSDISWCEDKYTMNPHIVEFLNTISNLPILFVALYELLLHSTNMKLRSDRKRHQSENIMSADNLFLLKLAFLCVPLFSIYFHATLSYAGQILDEVSILAFVILLDDGRGIQCIKALISLACLLIQPSLNRYVLISYGFMIAYKLFFMHKSEIQSLYGVRAVLLALTGFSVWVVDIVFCMNMPFSLHWAWHILTGMAGFYMIKLFE